ncbi:MAG: DUF47 family protein, partial [Desulfovibrionaceae bacterium]|nr:DUF47 family protein [Desulfovibrionaceae bacterium]MBF0513706.1 DUF47 family protein [Desulfovibrionaceae bacterium]
CVENKCICINIEEDRGDKLNRDIATQLASTFITPLDREDIHEINRAQEDILNIIQAIATRLSVYDFERIRFPFCLVVKHFVEMLEDIQVMLGHLSEKKLVTANIKSLKEHKTDCQMILSVALAENFDVDPDNPRTLLDVIKWTHVYDRLEQAVERADDLADIIEGIVIKNA